MIVASIDTGCVFVVVVGVVALVYFLRRTP
jgi:hypothetical protein